MKSPGHQQHPEHQVREKPLKRTVKVRFNDVTIAESKDVIELDEDKSPVRYYFPRRDVRMETLQPSKTTSTCPFKGSPNYFDLEADGQGLKDAVWTYNQPYDEHAALTQRVAFYDDKYPAISVTVEG
ncbi:MAG TPA: DUF427 domain-containing protein [Burkholderiaceae bacterium]|jgi:uncharacterized protein (DUF427 family)